MEDSQNGVTGLTALCLHCVLEAGVGQGDARTQHLSMKGLTAVAQ